MKPAARKVPGFEEMPWLLEWGFISVPHTSSVRQYTIRMGTLVIFGRFVEESPVTWLLRMVLNFLLSVVSLPLHLDGPQYTHHTVAFDNGASHTFIFDTGSTQSFVQVQAWNWFLLGFAWNLRQPWYSELLVMWLEFLANASWGFSTKTEKSQESHDRGFWQFSITKIQKIYCYP